MQTEEGLRFHGATGANIHTSRFTAMWSHDVASYDHSIPKDPYYWTSKVRDIPMRTLVAIKISAGRPPLRETVSTVRDLLKGGRYVLVQLGLVANIDLEAIRMRVSTCCMADLGSARDDQRADTGSFLEGDDTVDGAREDSLV